MRLRVAGAEYRFLQPTTGAENGPTPQKELIARTAVRCGAARLVRNNGFRSQGLERIIAQTHTEEEHARTAEGGVRALCCRSCTVL